MSYIYVHTTCLAQFKTMLIELCYTLINNNNVN